MVSVKIKLMNMTEEKRLEELKAFHIMDTPPDPLLDELTFIASEICDMPISLITLLDEERQWFKSNLGLKVNETPKEDAFCKFTLNTPDEVLVIEDAHDDKRFTNNPLVTGYPGIRFYAGAPLVTTQGNVLGTLCVIDTSPNKISENKKKALQMLASMAIKFMEERKLSLMQQESLELSANNLRKLTNKAPLVIFQFQMTPDGKMSFPFISEGISRLHPDLDVESVRANPELGFKNIHPEDLPIVLQTIEDSFINLTEWKTEFRVVSHDGNVEWHYGRSIPERLEDGTVVWYGTFQNITSHIEYENAMEQIAFDISHVLRRPVTTLLGLAQLIEREELDEESIKHYCVLIKTVSQELDNFTRKLNATYNEKSKQFAGLNNVYKE